MSDKTRVCYVGPPLALSGSTTVMVDVLNNLNHDKYETHLIIIPGSKLDAIEYLREDIIIHDARYLRSWWSRNIIVQYRFKKYIVQLIKNNKFDVFIVDHRKFNFLFSKLKMNLNFQLINRIGTILSWRIKQENKSFMHEEISNLLKKSDKIITPSLLAKNDLIDNFDIKSTSVECIYNAVDLKKIETLSQKKLEYNTSNKVILFVGRFSYGKNPLVLIDAFNIVYKKKKNIELWFVGDGILNTKLKQKADKYGISFRVKFWGFQKNPYKFYKRSDVVVHTSQMDGFGLVLIEAAFFNKQIVYSDTLVGANELLKKNNIGLPFNMSSEEDLAKQINKALDQKKDIYFDKIKDNISLDSFIVNYERVIDEVVDK